MTEQDQKITPVADATGDLSVGDLPPHLEPTAVESPESETVKGGGINRVVVTDGNISAKP